MDRAQRGRRDLAAPRERDLIRLGSRADEGAASHMTSQNAARFELTIGVGCGGPAQLEEPGHLALRGKPRARREAALLDLGFEPMEEPIVEALSRRAVELHLRQAHITIAY